MGSLMILTLVLLSVLSHAVTQRWGPLDYCCGFPKPVCTLELNPHCGSDGKTYGNRCRFCNRYIQSGKTLKLHYIGYCGKGGKSTED